MEQGKKSGLNPLSSPWGQKPKVEKGETVPSYLGLRNEAARDGAAAEKFITVTVRGLKGIPNGEYKLEWVEGSTLKLYLSKLKLLASAMSSAVRDLSNPEVGRVRLNYVPSVGAKIVLANPALSSAMQFQRSAHDAADVSLRMGEGAQVVEVVLPKR